MSEDQPISTGRIVGFSFLALGIIAVLAFGGFWINYAVQLQSTKNNYQINTNTQQYQNGIIAQLRNDDTGWQNASAGGQKTALKEQFCSLYKDLTEKPADLVSDYQSICVYN